MPFSKRRRGRRHHYGNQKLVVPMSQQMPPVASMISDGNGGFRDANIFDVPTTPTADLEVNGNCYAESPVSQFVGSYRFDFSRMFAHCLGQSNDANPVANPLASFFKRVKFHTGYMTIERIDTGITQRFVSGVFQVGTAGDPPNANSRYPIASVVSDPKPIPLDIYYLRLNPHEATFNEVASSPPLLRADPRTRKIRLMPGKSVTFKFHAQKFRPADYLVNCLRDWASDGAAETDQYRRAELPSRSRRLGWMPSSVVSRQRSLIPYTPAVPQGGLGADIFPICSKTILFHFDVPQVGAVTLGAGSGNQMLGYWQQGSDTPATNIAKSILIRRREFCAVSLANFVPPIQETGGAYVGAPAVGQIIKTVLYNGGTSSFNTTECYDPPHLRSIVAQTGQGPLWKPGISLSSSVFVPIDVPFDMEQAALPSIDPPPIPAVGQVP